MMNIPPSNQFSLSHLPEDLITEVLSWLPVKSLKRFSCVCKSWNTLFISDPAFIKLHRRRSALRRPGFLLQRQDSYSNLCRRDFCFAHFSGLDLVVNPCPSLVDDPGSYKVIGSCNGLLCLLGYTLLINNDIEEENVDGWLCIWNPATRLISGKFGSFHFRKHDDLNLSFGYDPSTDTYKVVKFATKWSTNHVSVFTLGNNDWRDIPNFTQSLFPCAKFIGFWSVNEGVHLNGTITWIAIHYILDTQLITADQYKILSLDLTTETNTLLLPPPVESVPFHMPTVGVLMDCLCYYYDVEETHFVIWQMKEFGVAESWSQLLKFSYQDLHLDCFGLVPLCLSNNDTGILVSLIDGQVILYNRRANTLERTTNPNKKDIWISAMDYVESLVPLY